MGADKAFQRHVYRTRSTKESRKYRECVTQKCRTQGPYCTFGSLHRVTGWDATKNHLG
jgi:hypothetical protein